MTRNKTSHFATSTESGFSLVEIMLSLSVTLIAAGAVGSLLYDANRSIAILQQKAEIQDLRHSLLTNYVVRVGVCSCQFDLPGATFNSAVTDGSEAIDIGELRNGCGAGPLIAKAGEKLEGSSTGLVVDQVRLANLQPAGAPKFWRGDIEVTFRGDSAKMGLKGAKISHSFEVDDSDPASAKIVACAQESDTNTGVVTAFSIPDGTKLCGYPPLRMRKILVNGVLQDAGNGASYMVRAKVNGSLGQLFIPNHPDGTAPVTMAFPAKADADGCYTLESREKFASISSLSVER